MKLRLDGERAVICIYRESDRAAFGGCACNELEHDLIGPRCRLQMEGSGDAVAAGRGAVPAIERGLKLFKGVDVVGELVRPASIGLHHLQRRRFSLFRRIRQGNRHLGDVHPGAFPHVHPVAPLLVVAVVGAKPDGIFAGGYMIGIHRCGGGEVDPEIVGLSRIERLAISDVEIVVMAVDFERAGGIAGAQFRIEAPSAETFGLQDGVANVLYAEAEPDNVSAFDNSGFDHGPTIEGRIDSRCI